MQNQFCSPNDLKFKLNLTPKYLLFTNPNAKWLFLEQNNEKKIYSLSYTKYYLILSKRKKNMQNEEKCNEQCC